MMVVVILKAIFSLQLWCSLFVGRNRLYCGFKIVLDVCDYQSFEYFLSFTSYITVYYCSIIGLQSKMPIIKRLIKSYQFYGNRYVDKATTEPSLRVEDVIPRPSTTSTSSGTSSSSK